MAQYVHLGRCERAATYVADFGFFLRQNIQVFSVLHPFRGLPVPVRCLTTVHLFISLITALSATSINTPASSSSLVYIVDPQFEREADFSPAEVKGICTTNSVSCVVEFADYAHKRQFGCGRHGRPVNSCYWWRFKLMNTIKLVRLNKMPILRQLLLEEALLRADSGNWCIVNNGTSVPAIVMGISG